MNIFFIELKAHRKSLILWCIGMLLMTFAGMSKFAAFDSTGQSINEAMSAFPDSIKTVLGLGDFDLSKASGFYGVLYLYLIVMATIHAVMLGANIIAKEERDKTTEFLFVKPISRAHAVTAKLLSSVVMVIILNLVTLVGSILIVNYYSTDTDFIGDIFLLMFSMFILQILFLSLGVFIASWSKKPRLASSISSGILLFTFMLSVIINVSNKIDFLKYLTPYKYFEAKDVMNGNGIQFIYLLISLFVVGLLTHFTYLFYEKRDLNI